LHILGGMRYLIVLANEFICGRPRRLSVDRSPNCLAVRSIQPLWPYGLPRQRQRRMAANSASVCGWLTCSVQSAGLGRGHSGSIRPSLFCVRQSRPSHYGEASHSAEGGEDQATSMRVCSLRANESRSRWFFKQCLATSASGIWSPSEQMKI
jgi:hypothetical protein